MESMRRIESIHRSLHQRIIGDKPDLVHAIYQPAEKSQMHRNPIAQLLGLKGCNRTRLHDTIVTACVDPDNDWV
jgi:hypothetical protein